MKSHLRANLFLFASTGVLCCLLYPAALLAVGQGLFPDTANGSLVARGGSRLLARPVTADEYFWPRPSAASYNAAASGGSNWGANNPKLRDRVLETITSIIQYKKASRFYAGSDPTKAVQRDVETWLDGKTPDAAAFAAWLRDPANADRVADLEPVTADMVMASGSGLDPHISLRNALSVYQLDRVAAKRSRSRDDIAAVVKAQSFTPLGGLVGEPLVNVLELNRALDDAFPTPAAR